MCKVLLRFCVSCLLCFSSAYLTAESYPTVARLHQVIPVADVAHANVAIDVKSSEGVALYKLQCHSAGYTGDSDFEYSGDFECRLNSIGHRDEYSTLLTEDPNQSRDWESCGRFFAADIQGSCASILQFGANRSFRLRGMNLTLQISDAAFTRDGKLKSLKLTVQVESDPKAKSLIAEKVSIPKGGVPPQCKLDEYFVDPATF